MHSTHHLSPALAELAASQAGVLTTRQLLSGGITRKSLHRLRKPWTTLAPGLVCLGPPTWHSLAYAGLLRGGDLAVIGTTAAGSLHGFVSAEPDTIVIWVPVSKVPRDLAHHGWRVRFRSGQRPGVGTPTRTKVEQSLLDIASAEDELTLVSSLTRALSQRLTTRERVTRALAARPRQRQRRLVEQICAAESEGLESALEWLYSERVQRAHGLPPLERQVRLLPGSRSDGWYPQYGVIIELDGRSHDDWSRDMNRDNRHALAVGALTLRYGWTDVSRRACATAEQVASALGQRGWTGTPRACPECRARHHHLRHS